jgi:hypothetical protein
MLTDLAIQKIADIAKTEIYLVNGRTVSSRQLAEALGKMLAEKDLEIERLKTMAEKQAEEIERLTALAKGSFWRSRAT